MKRKKTFVLLELLIAFALVGISILPFIRYPFAHMREEIADLFDMELQRVAESELAKAAILVYRGEVPEKQIFQKKKYVHTPYSVDENFSITIPNKKGMKRTYIKKVFIYHDKQKLDSDGTHSSLVTIRIHFFSPKNLQAPIKKVIAEVVAQKKNWVHVEGE